MSGNNNQEPGTCLTEIHYSFVSFHFILFMPCESQQSSSSLQWSRGKLHTWSTCFSQCPCILAFCICPSQMHARASGLCGLCGQDLAGQSFGALFYFSPPQQLVKVSPSSCCSSCSPCTSMRPLGFWSPTVGDGQSLASGTGSLFCKAATHLPGSCQACGIQCGGTISWTGSWCDRGLKSQNKKNIYIMFLPLKYRQKL